MPHRPASPRKAFTALLEPNGTALRWVVARLPFNIAAAWPQHKGRRVRGEIEGFAFRTTLFHGPGGEGHVLLVNKKMQAAAQVRQGSRVHIWLEPDIQERPIEMPAELARALNSHRPLRRWYDKLSDSMRREIGKWAAEPKSPASRQKRSDKIAERMLQAMEGEQDPPPVLHAIFAANPAARSAWLALTPSQRRNHLLGIFYYETAEGRERRAAKAVEEALRGAKRKTERAGG